MGYSDRIERRFYQRTAPHCDAKYSVDGKKWVEFNVADISSGGLQMHAADEFELNDRVLFDIILYGLSSELEFRAEGAVRRKSHAKHYYVYGISFVNMSNNIKIHIDEMIIHMRPRMFEIE